MEPTLKKPCTNAAIIVLAAMLVSLFLVAFTPGNASASLVVAQASSKSTVVPCMPSASYNYYTVNGKGQITDVRSSNSKVVSVGKSFGTWFDYRLRKAGKATITYKENGVQKTLAVTSVKYSNPIASFKVGGKEYKPKFNKTTSWIGKNANFWLNGKASVKLKSGWKLKALYTNGKYLAVDKKIKNGATLKNKAYAKAVVVNKKTKLQLEICVSAHVVAAG